MFGAAWVVVAVEEKSRKFTISPAFGRGGAGSWKTVARLAGFGRISQIMRPKLAGMAGLLAFWGLLSRESLDA
jgi:hypothetical protein